MKTKSINSWIDNEIRSLKKEAKQSKKKFLVLAIVHILINIATIVTAVIAIDLLVVNNDTSSVGVTLAALSAAFVIILFFINASISIYRSVMRAKYYNEAIEKIELENMKFETKQEEYKDKNAEEELMKNVLAIKKATLKKRRNKKATKIIGKALLGGTDA